MRSIHKKSEMEERITETKHVDSKNCNCRRCQHDRYDNRLKSEEIKES